MQEGPTIHRSRAWRRPAIVSSLAILVIGVLAATLWQHWSQLPPWRTLAMQFLDASQHWGGKPFAPLLALATFVVGGFVLIPVSWMTAAAIVVFGPWFGGVYALLGAVLSAWVVYELGWLLPAATFDRWFGERGRKLRARVVGHGLIAILLVRVVPVAPYSVISFLAGAARLRRSDFLLGSALGMLHDVILYGFFANRARAALLDPHLLTFVLLGAAVLLFVVAAMLVHLWHRTHRRKKSAAQEKTHG